MDEKLEKALAYSNYMTTLHNQSKIFQEQYAQNSIYYTNGNQFTVTKELISFCDTMIRNDHIALILVDDNNIPVNVEDLKSFFKDILNVYFRATNRYLTEYSQIRKQRTVENLVNL